MKLINLQLLTALCLGLPAGAQTLDMDIKLAGTLNPEETRIFIHPVNDVSDQSTIELPRNADGTFSGQVNINPDGLYYFYSATPNAQMSLPFYVAPQTAKQSITISDGPNYTTTSSLTDPVNIALNTYASSTVAKAIAVGNNLPELSDEQIRSIMESYVSEADSIIASTSLPPQVEQFMRLWAYTSASDSYSLARHLSQRAGRHLGFTLTDILPAPQTVLDSPMAASFPSSSLLIMGTLPKGSLEERLTALYDTYKTPTVRETVTSMLVTSFMDKFDYNAGFTEGENRLQALTEKYSLPDSYLATFRARRATVPGAAFPDVELVDREGNKVDFSKFKGKYVYVDLWASWCGPCVREVPYLQQLEKDFEGSDVIFVSISIDSAKAPWIKKMDQLNMHGNQLWNSDGNLAERLNIRGIPHFLIYGPEGTLHTYNAPRPSDEATRQLLQSLK